MSDPITTSTINQSATTTDWFRSAAPYIHAHRGATFVISLDGETIASDHIDKLVHDLALLNSLGIKLIIAFGARHQIEQACQQQAIPLKYHQGLRVTDMASLQVAKSIIGQIRIELEAKLSFSLPDTAMAEAKIRCSSGNFVTAKPLGILQGIDFGHTGEVRKIDTNKPTWFQSIPDATLKGGGVYIQTWMFSEKKEDRVGT